LKKPLQKVDQEPQWLERIRDYYWIHDVLNIYVGFFTWIIQWDDENRLEWMEMTPQTPSQLRPVHFEKYFGRAGERDAYFFRSLKRVFEEKRMVIDQFGGFYDVFLPLKLSGKRRAVLYTGYFLKEPANWESLSIHWRKLSRREPSATDPDFISYVRMALRLAVLDDTLLEGVCEFLEYYASFLTGQNRFKALHKHVDQLRRKVFAVKLPNPSWTQEALGFEKLIPPPWDWYADRQLAPWMKEELGISRIPTVVIAIMPLRGRKGSDTVQTLIQNYQIQRESFQFAKTLSQTVAEKLQDYGMVFLTSPDNSKGEVQARLQIRERAEAIREFIRKRFGLKSVAGIGRPVPAGDALFTSYREAVLALHLCVQKEKPVLFYGDDPEAGRGQGYIRLHQAEADLLEAYGWVSSEDIKLVSDQYVREILEYSAGNTSIVRNQFLSLLFQIFERVRKRSILNPQDAESYATDFCRKLEDADSVYRLIEVFKETLEVFSTMAVRPLEGSKNLRIETTLKYLADNFNQPLRLPQVARQTGFSIPVFCRVFKQTTGLSFISYVNKLRVEQAKILLKTSGMNVLQIGQSCGFQTPHHFIRNFKNWMGMTPGDFRKINSSRSKE
jgi:AraC-like DNA-binding protein